MNIYEVLNSTKDRFLKISIKNSYIEYDLPFGSPLELKFIKIDKCDKHSFHIKYLLSDDWIIYDGDDSDPIVRRK